jgi:hypothetical protein
MYQSFAVRPLSATIQIAVLVPVLAALVLLYMKREPSRQFALQGDPTFTSSA